MTNVLYRHFPKYTGKFRVSECNDENFVPRVIALSGPDDPERLMRAITSTNGKAPLLDTSVVLTVLDQTNPWRS